MSRHIVCGRAILAASRCSAEDRADQPGALLPHHPLDFGLADAKAEEDENSLKRVEDRKEDVKRQLPLTYGQESEHPGQSEQRSNRDRVLRATQHLDARFGSILRGRWPPDLLPAAGDPVDDDGKDDAVEGEDDGDREKQSVVERWSGHDEATEDIYHNSYRIGW